MRHGSSGERERETDQLSTRPHPYSWLRNFWLCSSAILGGVCLALAATSLPAAAQSTDWTGAASSNWFDASNWTNGVPAAGGGPAAVDATAPNAPVVNAPGAAADVIAVGVGAVGALTITGGTLSSVDGYVGYILGSHGTVTVTGPGSNWSNSQILYVGYFGTATLTIEGGGTVSSLYRLCRRGSRLRWHGDGDRRRLHLDQQRKSLRRQWRHGHAHHRGWRNGEQRDRLCRRPR